MSHPLTSDPAPSTRPLAALRPHPSPSRPLSARHVIDMARSIAALGLIHPLVIDLDGVVVAGAHRFAALRLLAAPTDERQQLLADLAPIRSAEAEAVTAMLARLPALPDLLISPDPAPVHIMPLSVADDPDGAWRVEVAENERRRDYSAGEVRGLADRLRAQGYHMTRGPAQGKPSALPVLTALVGKSERTVRRLLAEAGGLRPDDRNPMEDDRKAAAAALDRFRRRHGSALSEGQAKKIRQALEVLDALAR